MIKKISLIFAVLFVNGSLAFAQSEKPEVKVVDITKAAAENNEPTIMIAAPLSENPEINPDVRPDFQGGQGALNLFISKNLRYPKKAIANDIQGMLVVQIDVAKDGTATFAKFIRELGYGCEEEALRLIKIMPKWKPAMLNGKPVDFNYLMRVSFKLED